MEQEDHQGTNHLMLSLLIELFFKEELIFEKAYLEAFLFDYSQNEDVPSACS